MIHLVQAIALGSATFTAVRVLYRLGCWMTARRPPPLSTDLRAVYRPEPTEDELRMIRAYRPRLRDIAGWDAETLARMQAAVRREPGNPSFLDAVEDAIPADS